MVNNHLVMANYWGSAQCHPVRQRCVYYVVKKEVKRSKLTNFDRQK